MQPRPPNAGWTVLASKNYIKLEIVDGSWSQSSDRATELRAALQGTIQAGNNREIARLKQEVGAVLAEHRALTDEYKRLKAQRPDWKTPERSH